MTGNHNNYADAKCGGVEHEWKVLERQARIFQTKMGTHYTHTMYCVWCLDVRLLSYELCDDEPGIKNRRDYR